MIDELQAFNDQASRGFPIDQLSIIDHVTFRLSILSEYGDDSVPTDDFDRWLWVAKGLIDGTA